MRESRGAEEKGGEVESSLLLAISRKVSDGHDTILFTQSVTHLE